MRLRTLAICATIVSISPALDSASAVTVLNSQEAVKALSVEKLDITPTKISGVIVNRRRIRSRTSSS